eukprot:5733522-Prymnesium_polylepis.1
MTRTHTCAQTYTYARRASCRPQNNDLQKGPLPTPISLSAPPHTKGAPLRSGRREARVQRLVEHEGVGAAERCSHRHAHGECGEGEAAPKGEAAGVRGDEAARVGGAQHERLER